jgi:signal transduction histidine kinase
MKSSARLAAGNFFDRQYATLLALNKSTTIDAGDLLTAGREILVAAANTLLCERTSIWLYDQSRSTITCALLYERATKTFSSGQVLHAKDYPVYFRHLSQKRFIAADNATTDVATSEFAESYLLPLHIVSLLDAPIWLNGEMVGVLCNEECEEARAWTEAEQFFAGSLADFVTRAMLAEARKKAQLELTILNQNLENQVAEKTEYLKYINRKLAESLDDSEEKLLKMQRLNREKSALLGVVAHDLKNPLTGILSFTELALANLPDAEAVRRYIHLIQDVARRMSVLISQMLTEIAIETGQIPLRKRLIDIGHLAKIVVSMNDEQARQKQQKIITTAESGCVALVDEDRLCELMDNLVSNAIKYSPQERQIWVGVTCFEETVRFFVKDEGQGLTQEDKQQLFQTFQRLSAKPTAGESSTGLGLAIAKRLVELHGGRIWAESDGKDKGSTFIVELPLATSLE